ncbi:pyridoxamine 5'-phosphate oxidase family protein [Aureispira anguillae]|uniref:Pyridoxamine 5'-phosphate oxidase family protein n=1 Tax=Aureispira anguillae TaxID=2864201 RepID=A0A916DRS5_9BACT|nr:pyridoxamine 5'-phosphate oxidase family protein [Aureispira anguillae]BDS10810.1 pyridoxamine 5'-phosphate oxidase family protein [Aureispira anguillae]
MERVTLKTERTTVKRVPKRGIYDKERICQILDQGYLANIGFTIEGQTFVIPTLYGRLDDHLYIHGAASSRMLKSIVEQSICFSVSLVNGIVLARSAFHHSMNYQSVSLLGQPVLVENLVEKELGLKIISDHLIPNRWEEVRGPNTKELKGTTVLKLLIEEGAAKVRTGHPKDEKQDYDLAVWAGQIPLKTIALEAIDDELLRPNISVSPSVQNYIQNINS